MKKKMLFVMLAAGFAQMASAGFVDESATNPFAESQQIRVIGAGQFDSIPGFAKGVPLHEALSQIIPRSYSVRASGLESVSSKTVNWQGGKPWNVVLADILAQVPEVTADIDTSSKIVTFMSAIRSYPATIAEVSPVEGVTAGGAAVEPSAEWVVRQDDLTVKGVLQRWTTQAQWQLIWEMQIDFPVEAEAKLVTTFEQAVETLTKSLQANGNPPKAIIYRGNRVLRVVARGTE